MPLMSQHSPLVSIIITTYNGKDYILETINSILSQTYKNFELIIVDDASADQTTQIIRSSKDKRIRLITNSNNLGISKSRNLGLSLAKGKYVAMSDQDDLSAPTRIAKQVAFLEKNPDVGMVATAAKELRFGKINSIYKSESRSHIIGWRLLYRCNIVHSSVCYRLDILNKHKLSYNDSYRYAEDFVLFNEISQISNISILDEELVTYREHEKNASSIHNLEMRSNSNRYLKYVYEDILKKEVSLEDVSNIRAILSCSAPSISTYNELSNLSLLYYLLLNRYLLKLTDLAPSQEQEILEIANYDFLKGSLSTVSYFHTFSFYFHFFTSSLFYKNLPILSKIILEKLNIKKD